MEQIIGNSCIGNTGNSLKNFLNRRRLEPLPEEDDSSGSDKVQVGWW